LDRKPTPQQRHFLLRVGAYSISIAADGFKRFNQRGVVLDIGPFAADL